jgi:PAS domain-containing protein
VVFTLFALIGYAYDARSLDGVTGPLGMALQPALVLCALGFGVLCARPGEGHVALLMSDAPGGAVKRRLMPAVLGIPIMLGWLSLMGRQAALYDTSTGTALLVIATGVVLAALVHRSAVTLDRSDAQRRQADERTRNVQASLDSIIENVPNMVFVKEAADLRFVRINKAGEDLLGVTRDELIGRNDFDFFPREEAEFFTAKDRVALTAGALRTFPKSRSDAAQRYEVPSHQEGGGHGFGGERCVPSRHLRGHHRAEGGGRRAPPKPGRVRERVRIAPRRLSGSHARPPHRHRQRSLSRCDDDAPRGFARP